MWRVFWQILKQWIEDGAISWCHIEYSTLLCAFFMGRKLLISYQPIRYMDMVNRKSTISAFGCVLAKLQIPTLYVDSDLKMSPLTWVLLVPCCCMWKLRPGAEDWFWSLLFSQNVTVTLPGTIRGSWYWAVMLIGAVMTSTPADTTQQWGGLTSIRYMTNDCFDVGYFDLTW